MNTPRSRLSGLGTIGDFTASPRMLVIAGMAAGIGVLGAGFAEALLRLIAFFTNLFFYQRFSDASVSPALNHLGAWVILVPVVGFMVVAVMARFGSEKIRGHGIPEALEAILLRGSRAEPKLVVLKPVATAISIGAGGPFGAEGPIIVTTGSFGSIVAQLFNLTDQERKTLLVAGAAAGMAAIFATPLAAILLAVELLLFEWKPRSLVPVAVASMMGFATRQYLLGPGPLFPVPPHPAFVGVWGLVSCLFAGLAAGLLALTLTTMIYWSEDAFAKLPIHWVWWPALGGLAVGLGGWIFPTALGVGYDTIGLLLQGHNALRLVCGILIFKSLMWAISLGSGTSGGILAPLLMMGAALGGLESYVLPNEGAGFWPLVSMAAVLGGTMRAPLTAVVFSLELTHDLTIIVPALLAVVVAHAFTVLVLPRSILTEKVSRRGVHVSAEYSVDPLEVLLVRSAMSPIDAVGVLMGDATTIPANVPLRVAAYRMAETGLRRLDVVQAGDAGKVIGVITLDDLLKARVANLDAESTRRRPLRLWQLVTMFSNSNSDGDPAVPAKQNQTPGPLGPGA